MSIFKGNIFVFSLEYMRRAFLKKYLWTYVEIDEVSIFKENIFGIALKWAR
jgi:hypothetical protein